MRQEGAEVFCLFTFCACLCAFFSHRWEHTTERVHLFFRAFDKNKDGRLSFQELILGFAMLLRGNLSQKLRVIFNAFDVDSSDSISREELYELVYTVNT